MTIAVDVVVNAVNSSLLGGGGVDGTVHRAARPTLSKACKQVMQQQGECPTGHTVIALADALLAKAVIRAIGPVWQGGDHHGAEWPEEAHLNTLQLTLANDYQSIVSPAISTGAYGHPHVVATEITVKMVLKSITRCMLPGQTYFIYFDEENARLYKRLLTQQGDERTD